MKTLHRSDSPGSGAWCGQILAFGHDDSTWVPLSDPSFVGRFHFCQKCVDMYGDVLPENIKKPKVVHNRGTGANYKPYPCGSSDGLFASGVNVSEEHCAAVQPFWVEKLVPCRKCMALENVPKSPTPVKKVDDGFNGNCLRCGMRTYTGVTPTAFEHQGGPCTGQAKWAVR